MEQRPIIEELDEALLEEVDRQRFKELFNRATMELKIEAKTLAQALADTIDPGIYTIDHWRSGEIAPPQKNHAIIFQTLGNIARERLAQEEV